MGNFDARSQAGSGNLKYGRIDIAFDEFYHFITNQHRPLHAFRGQGSQSFLQQLGCGIGVPSSGVFTDNLPIAAFDGIYDQPVDSRPFLPIMRPLNCRTKENFHLNSCSLFIC